MKAKTVKAILRKKIDAWAETIGDPEIKRIAQKESIVTGGCIASMLLREAVNDFDIYFRTKAAAAAVARYYVKQFKENPPPAMDGKPIPIHVDSEGDRVRVIIKSAGIASEEGDGGNYQYFENRSPEEAADYVGEVMTDPGQIEDTYLDAEAKALEAETKPPYRPVFLSTNAITLSNKIQVILRFYGEPDEIHENYDFVHCTCYWTAWDNHLELRPAALEAMLARELRYVGSKYPLCSLIRVRKFMARKWTINAGQIVKMCLQLNELDLREVSVLEDQLTGVDVAYFCEVISLLKAKDKERVDSTYLLEIIDRLF